MVKKVLVLMGGRSAEREVSLSSGTACAKALRDAGYDVDVFDPQGPVRDLVAAIGPVTEDLVVFNALHGRWGEDGTIQGLLDLLGVKYTHSGLLASAVAMDKPMAKMVMEKAGIPCPQGMVKTREDMLAGDPLPRPYVVKPINEGSSVGVHIVKEGDPDLAFSAESWPFGDEVLVEHYIAGREVTVTVIGEGETARALAVTEIRPQPGTFYDYDAKYNQALAATHIIPAEISAAETQEALRLSVAAHRALGCRGVARADLLQNEQGDFFVLEVNTQPGMTEMSLVPEQAVYTGLSFQELCVWMVENARCDH